MNVPIDPEAFFDYIFDVRFSSEEILEIMNLHDHSRSDCAVCGYITENRDEFLFEILISRNAESVTEEIIDRSLKYMNDYVQFFEGGNAEIVCYRLCLHKNSSQDALERGIAFYGLSIDIGLQGEKTPDPKETDFVEVLKEVAAHPKVDEEIFLSWLEAGHYALEQWGHEGAVEVCDWCRIILEEVWGRGGFEQ